MRQMATRVLLIHGAATTPAVWHRLLPLLADEPGVLVHAPLRPRSGDLDTELEFLAELARDSIVVGASGGATLGLALLAGDVRLAGGVLHEPAVGSLVPGLLDHVVAGWNTDGVAGFGRALYGPSWTPTMAGPDPDAVGRDLAMFRRYEPAPIAAGQGPVIATVGGDSPPVRRRAAAALQAKFGIPSRELPESGHFVVHDNPQALAAVVLELVRGLRAAGDSQPG